MIKFICDNGSFEIQSSREWRGYGGQQRTTNLDITVTSQAVSIDEIENILTNPDISSFSIMNEINGNLVGKYEGYELKSIAKTAQGNMVAIQITFSKEI